jgi:hypothetical protein
MIVIDNNLREFFLDILGNLSIKEIVSNYKLMQKGEKVVHILNLGVLV